MKAACLFVVASLCVAVTFAAEGSDWDYHPMTEWTGACATGKKQSPINIDAKDAKPAVKAAGKVEFGTFGTLKKYTIYSTGFALQVSMEEFSKPADIKIPANDYTIGDSKTVKQGDMLKVTPLQMHLHTMSEHTIDGFYGPAELHIVTKVDDGQSDYCDKTGGCLAVFGIMLTYEGEGKKANKAVARLFKTAPGSVGPDAGVSPKAPLDLDKLLPASLDYYNYLGSLTTPPCTEIVTWHVFVEPVAISADLIDEHQRMVSYTVGDDCTFSYFGVCTPPREKTNHRNVQPYYGRDIFLIKE